MALTKVDISLMDNVGTTANKLLAYDGSGNLPAVDGSQITNVATGITESSSDPTVSTNPSGGVGTQWNNTTSGEVYICTDATAGANIWTNVGAGSGNVKPWEFGGSSYGFMSAGLWYGGQSTNTINRFSFTSDGNGTDWGDLVGTIKYAATGHSDKENSYAYNSGGYGAAPYVFNEIARYSMASAGGSADVGDLTQITSFAASATNATHCYSIGHEYNAGAGGDGTVVSRWAFASTVNASDWSDLMGQQYGGGGATNAASNYGYKMGGGSPTTNRIQKVNLTSAAIATDVADTTVARHSSAGNSSSTHGYCSAGHSGSHSNVTDKFNMSTDANSTDVGDLTISAHQRGGASSLTYGYVCGGVSSNNTIEKHSFTTDGNAADVGDLNLGLISPAGSQF